jgi:hemin uptake protein HemP
MKKSTPPGRSKAISPEAATQDAPRADATAPATTGTARRAISSAEILRGHDAIDIEHNGRIYQLRRTRQGKLILTK